MVTRLGDIRSHDETDAASRRVIERRQPIVGGERVAEVHAEAVPAERLRQALVACQASARPRPDGAAARIRIRSPTPLGRRNRRATRRRAARTRDVPGTRAAIADPQFGVRQRIDALALDDPRVQRHRRVPRPTAGTRSRPSTPPRVSQLPSSWATPPGARCVADAVHERRRRGRRRPSRRRGTRTAGTPAVRGVMTNGGFDTMRSNSLARDRVEQAPGPHLDPVDAVQEGVQPRVAQRALRDVGRDDMVDAPPGAQGLDAASGAEVEAPGGRRRQLQRCERQRRTARPRAHGPRAAVRRARPRPGRSRSTTRRRRPASAKDCGADQATVSAGTSPHRRMPRARARRVPSAPVRGSADATALDGLRHPEHEQPPENRERVGRDRRAARAAGRAQTAGDGVVGGFAPRLAQRIGGESGVREGRRRARGRGRDRGSMAVTALHSIAPDRPRAAGVREPRRRGP